MVGTPSRPPKPAISQYHTQSKSSSRVRSKQASMPTLPNSRILQKARYDSHAKTRQPKEHLPDLSRTQDDYRGLGAVDDLTRARALQSLEATRSGSLPSSGLSQVLPRGPDGTGKIFRYQHWRDKLTLNKVQLQDSSKVFIKNEEGYN